MASNAIRFPRSSNIMHYASVLRQFDS